MSKAFDLAQFVQVPSNVNDGVVIQSMGPPFITKFSPMVTSPSPGVIVEGSIPRATGAGQILLSSAAAGNPWTLGTNPAIAAAVPPPVDVDHILMSDSVPSWQDATIGDMLAAGGAVTETTGGTFDSASDLAFTASAAASVRLDGDDATKSFIDHFTLDCGTY